MLISDVNKEPENIALKVIGQCPVCRAVYSKNNINLFSQTLDFSVMHLECPKCKIGFVAGIFRMEQGISTVGALTDLNFNDIKRLQEEEQISLDDVLDFTKKLNNNEIKF